MRTVKFLPGVEEDPPSEAQRLAPVITTNDAFYLLHDLPGHTVSDALSALRSGRFVHIQVPVDRPDVVEVLFIAPATFGGEPAVVMREDDPQPSEIGRQVGKFHAQERDGEFECIGALGAQAEPLPSTCVLTESLHEESVVCICLGDLREPLRVEHGRSVSSAVERQQLRVVRSTATNEGTAIVSVANRPSGRSGLLSRRPFPSSVARFQRRLLALGGTARVAR